MFKKLISFLKPRNPHKQSASKYVVTFTGGMGNQILSASVYFYLKSIGKDVYADFRYFSLTPQKASPGTTGECSIWPWQLDGFGLCPDSFRKFENFKDDTYHLIADGEEKGDLSIKALQLDIVAQHFNISSAPPSISRLFLWRALSLHAHAKRRLLKCC